MPVFSSIVAILFFLNCQKQDYMKGGLLCQCVSLMSGITITQKNNRNIVPVTLFIHLNL